MSSVLSQTLFLNWSLDEKMEHAKRVVRAIRKIYHGGDDERMVGLSEIAGVGPHVGISFTISETKNILLVLDRGIHEIDEWHQFIFSMARTGIDGLDPIGEYQMVAGIHVLTNLAEMAGLIVPSPTSATTAAAAASPAPGPASSAP